MWRTLVCIVHYMWRTLVCRSYCNYSVDKITLSINPCRHPPAEGIPCPAQVEGVQPHPQYRQEMHFQSGIYQDYQ